MNDTLFFKLLYSPEQEISIKDVKQFCLGSSENDRLEYKRWDDKLKVEKVIKEIIAMANTDGGLIIIGVQEEKDTGGRRDYAGNIEGIPLKEANSLKQSIEVKCINLTTPQWRPEILHISGLEGGKSVLLIRIDPDKVEGPLLFNENDKLVGPFIRKGTEITIATWEEIVDIANQRIDSSLEERKKEAASWTRWAIDPFGYCSIALVFKKRRYGEFVSWRDSEYQKIINCVRNHRLLPGGPFVWRTALHPAFIHPWPPGMDLPDTFEETSAKNIFITPRLAKDWKQGNKCFKFNFSTRGFITATVGYSKTPTTSAGKILGIIFVVLDLLHQKEVLSYYQTNFLLDKADLIFRVTNSPQEPFILTTYPFEYNYREKKYPLGQDIIVEKYKRVSLMDFNAEALAKEFTKELVKNAGFRGLENEIDNFDIQNVVRFVG